MINAASEEGLSRQALTMGFLATAIIFGLAPPARAKSPPSGRVTSMVVPATPRTDPTAKNMSLESQQLPPGARVVSQIHNAAGWRPSDTYTYATGPYTRVVSGPGWNPAKGNYNPGQALNAYQLTSTGTCTSASGSGPRGTEASIKDGTCVWKYLSPVDYISITGWAFDNRPWAAATYHRWDYVTSDSPLRAYAASSQSCVSTVPPTGTSNSTTSDGCQWQYRGDIVYTSAKSFIPTEVPGPGGIGSILMLRANYQAELWNDREYVAGKNGENAPIRTQDHDDYRAEGTGEIGGGCTPKCHIIITTSPGESFRDTLNSSDPLMGYDPTKGVAIRNSQPRVYPFAAAGIDVHDNYTDLIGLEIKSINGEAVNGMSSFANAMTLRDCILDGGNGQFGSGAAYTTDTASFVSNSLIIAHSPFGVIFKYPGLLTHSTIVAPDQPANSIAVYTWNVWVYDNTTVFNSALFGFSHAGGFQWAGTGWSTASAGNVTDAPVGDSGSVGGTTVSIIPGTTYGSSMAAAFISPGTDWRPKPGGPLYGGGGALGDFTINCTVFEYHCPSPTYNFDSRSIIGTARPRAGHYDIGAW